MKKYVFIVCAMLWAAATLQARKGYEKSYHLDVKAGIGQISQTYNAGITMTNGYRFNGHFLLGANVGIAFSEYVENPLLRYEEYLVRKRLAYSPVGRRQI